METYVQIVDVHTGLYALIDIMESRMFNSSYSNPSSPVHGHYGQRSNPKAAAFMVLARLVRRFEKRLLEREVGKVVPLAIRVSIGWSNQVYYGSVTFLTFFCLFMIGFQ